MILLGQALIHFLWQGALLGLVCWLGLRLTESPRTRYALAAATMAVMALAVPATMLVMTAESGTAVERLRGASGLVLDTDWGGATPSWPWIPLVWACGSLVLSMRAVAGWTLARRRTSSGQACPAWQQRVDVLAARMGLGRVVRVFENTHIDAPQVFGWLKPVLLLPAGALAGLAPEQLEAVIAHELAHVRRNDYLVNLLQVAVECLLYYHPAVWWVSRRLRVERELCCDEEAVELCGDRLLYSRALLRLEETRAGFAMAAGVGLKERIGRILGMRERTNGLIPALSLGAVALLFGGWLWATTQEPPKPPQPPPPPKVAAVDKAERERRVKFAKEHFGSVDDGRAKAYIKYGPPDTIDKRSGGVEQWGYRQGILLRFKDGRLATEDIRVPEPPAPPNPPAPPAPPKLDQVELQRRIHYANERFSEPGIEGAKTDRGKVYLKYGPPDEIETHKGTREEWRYREGRWFVFDGGNRLKEEKRWSPEKTSEVRERAADILAV